jgi:hypothetical protein
VTASADQPEELMLHLAIDDARDRAADPDDDERPDLDLPSHSDDYDWDVCVETLFQDTDILLVDQAWAGGVENPDSGMNRDLGIGGRARG